MHLGGGEDGGAGPAGDAEQADVEVESAVFDFGLDQGEGAEAVGDFFVSAP